MKKTSHDDRTMISQLARALQYAENEPGHTSEAAKLSIMQAIYCVKGEK